MGSAFQFMFKTVDQPEMTGIPADNKMPDRRPSPQKVFQKTYQKNRESNFTEKIEALDDHFNYADNSGHYWSEPQQSLLYGTPFYQEASETQKLALNHLYWVFGYTATAAAEVQTTMFNQVTAGVFQQLGGYDTLYQELELETEQEKSHIHAFNKINQKTTNHLLGPGVFSKLLKRPQIKASKPSKDGKGKARALGFIAKGMLKHHSKTYSPYLRDLETKYSIIPAPTSGFGYLGKNTATQDLLRFYIMSWGGSPFLASQYYNVRYMANMLLKNREHKIFRYCRKLQKKEAFIPAPTAVSYYHLLDEAFHTNMSQVIGRDLYHEWDCPTPYEKFLSNISIYWVQSSSLQGLNAGIPGLYLKDEKFFMGFLYQLLQQPLFGLSAPEALQRIQECFGEEHEGLHVSAQWHQQLLNDHCRFFQEFSYLWPVNRDFRLMASGGKLDRVMAQNKILLQEFTNETLRAESETIHTAA
jgi:hypothetical protein